MEQSQLDKFFAAKKWAKNLSDKEIGDFLDTSGRFISIPPLTSIDIDALRNERIDRMSQ